MVHNSHTIDKIRNYRRRALDGPVSRRRMLELLQKVTWLLTVIDRKKRKQVVMKGSKACKSMKIKETGTDKKIATKLRQTH